MDWKNILEQYSQATLLDRAEGQLTLGRAIALLADKNPMYRVWPCLTNPHAYHGYPTDIAFEPSVDMCYQTVGELRALLFSLFGRQFRAEMGPL